MVTITPGKRTTTTRRMAIVRLGLGVAQMSTAAFALGVLLVEGVTPGALAAAVIACTLTTVSVLVFGGRGPTN